MTESSPMMGNLIEEILRSAAPEPRGVFRRSRTANLCGCAAGAIVLAAHPHRSIAALDKEILLLHSHDPHRLLRYRTLWAGPEVSGRTGRWGERIRLCANDGATKPYSVKQRSERNL